jgi:HPt (histidine-containing phosphotransfer) domain-containing protein
MDGYLAKPIDKDALLNLVARSLNPQTAGSRFGNTTAGELDIDHADFDELRLLAEVTEHDFVTELIDAFVHDTDQLLVQMRDASSRGDADAVNQIAHSIKGSGGQLGGRRLAASCDRLERRATTGALAGGLADLAEVENDYQALRATLTEQRASGDSRLRGGRRA